MAFSPLAPPFLVKRLPQQDQEKREREREKKASPATEEGEEKRNHLHGRNSINHCKWLIRSKEEQLTAARKYSNEGSSSFSGDRVRRKNNERATEVVVFMVREEREKERKERYVCVYIY